MRYDCSSNETDCNFNCLRRKWSNYLGGGCCSAKAPTSSNCKPKPCCPPPCGPAPRKRRPCRPPSPRRCYPTEVGCCNDNVSGWCCDNDNGCCLGPEIYPQQLCYNTPPCNDPCCPCSRQCKSPCKRMKGRFAFAFMAESPCLCCPPRTFEVEICDTPSTIEMECKRLMEWANGVPVQQRHVHKHCCCDCCKGHCTYLIKNSECLSQDDCDCCW